MCLHQKLYCRLLHSVGTDEAVENHMLESKLELKEVKISISCFLFFVCFYIQVITLFTTQPLALSQGRAEWLKSKRDCVHPHERCTCMCVCLPSCICAQCV